MKNAQGFYSKITGTGSAFPSKVLTNDDLAKKVETSDEWIRERTGIRERRISDVRLPHERNSGLGHQAAVRALEMAGRRADEIDTILYATCTPDTLLPSTASWLQSKLGAKNAWGLDVNAACSGFVSGLAVADQFIRSGQSKVALVVGADVLSAMTDWEDRASCILFGDGAGAVILERTEDEKGSRILSTQMGLDGDLWELFHIPAGGSNQEVTPEKYAARDNKMKMKGKEIFKYAVRGMADLATQALEKNGLKVSDIDWVIAHQANLRIIEAVAKRIDLPMEKMLVNIDVYGNTSAGTVPSVLDQSVRSGKIKRGQLVLLDVFGSGLTYGSALVRF
ncbi:MAG: ketoacyl-ACP synthase III [Bdellovibrionales bacterium]|nr:ketoacyl-ACP synthase III [Bdellovibrionales bacterium]